MKVELTPEQLECIYNIVSEKLTWENKRLNHLEDGLRLDLHFDCEVESITDILKKRLELSSFFEIKKIFEKAIKNET